MNPTADPSQPPSLAAQLHSVQLGLREDLDVSRHLFRGEPSYIVRDPVTFQSQRLTPADYNVFVRIDASRSLGVIFQELVAEGKTTEESEELFYSFIMSLHRIGFLRLPVSDDKILYRRHQMKARARAREKVTGILFLKIPLVNPNAFLDRTVHLFRGMFTVKFFILWAAVIGSAGWIIFRRWTEITEPLQGLLATQNIALMWITLIGLKLWHEFGHAYCCKHYGGHVPEMGAYLILFTPCAYVDATASWGFRNKRHRIYVCLAGMYFESMLAALAVFIWAMTGPGLLHDAAHNAIFLATVVTVLFNINPLMRYDGYYVLSDLVEIPNLRAKSTNHVIGVLKRILFGIPNKAAPAALRERLVLLFYGIFASIYRVTLLLAISAVLASKVFVVGILLAAGYLGSTAFKTLTKLTNYLWQAEETKHARFRAATISALAFLIIPAALFFVPVPASVNAGAVLLAEHETVAYAREPGFLDELFVECGKTVHEGLHLARLSNDAYDEQIATAQSEIDAARIRIDAFRVHNPAFVNQEKAQTRLLQESLNLARARKSDLLVAAPGEGRVVQCLQANESGKFVDAGEPVATIVSGRWQLRAILNEEQIAAVNPTVGDAVRIKTAARTGTTLNGTIGKIASAGSRTIQLASLTHVAGGAIAVDPSDGTAQEPYFELTINLPKRDIQGLRYGMTGIVNFAATPQPIGVRLTHRVARFVNKLLRE